MFAIEIVGWEIQVQAFIQIIFRDMIMPGDKRDRHPGADGADISFARKLVLMLEGLKSLNRCICCNCSYDNCHYEQEAN